MDLPLVTLADLSDEFFLKNEESKKIELASGVIKTYTASRGVRMVDNDIRLDVSTVQGSSLMVDGNGKVYFPNSASVLNTKLVPLQREADTPNRDNLKYMQFALQTVYIPQALSIKVQGDTPVVDLQPALTNVRYAVRFVEGSQYIEDAILPVSTVFGDDTASEAIGGAFTTITHNETVNDFSFGLDNRLPINAVKFTIPELYAYLPQTILFRLKINMDSAPQGIPTTIRMLCTALHDELPDRQAVINLDSQYTFSVNN